MTSRSSSLRQLALGLVVALLVTSMATAFVGVAARPATAATGECSTHTTVKHVKFKTNETAITKVANGSNVTSTTENTRVRLGSDNTFYRLTGANPNGYCVRFVVHIAKKAMPAADIPGNVTSNNGEYSATWAAEYNWNTSQTFTNVSFTLPPGTTATFAPNKGPVVAISWASEKVSKGDSLLSGLTSKWGKEEDIVNHTYRIEPEEKTRVRVPLRNPETDEKIDEWKAMYTTDNGETWYKVPQKTDSPVYYEHTENETALRFTFTNADAEVKFMANPTATQTAHYQYETYTSGIGLLKGIIPGLVGPPVPAAGPAGGA